MLGSTSIIALLLSFSELGLASIPQGQTQVVLAPPPVHVVDDAILAALKKYDDPVDALLFLQPESAAALAKPRLLHVFGEEKPQWLTEGDKMRLRRAGKKFMDVTDHEDFYSQQVDASTAGKACESSLFVSDVLCLTFHQTCPTSHTRTSSNHSSPMSRSSECMMFSSI